MSKCIIVILLMAKRIMRSVSINILSRDFGHDLNLVQSSLPNGTCDITLPPFPVVTFMARWIAQVKLSAQIVLSFFFFGWRNSIYDGNTRNFSALFSSLETQTGF